MPDETRISDILAQAEEELARGRQPDLAALCEADPHLLPVIQRRLKELRAVDAVCNPRGRPTNPSPHRPAVPPGYELVRELGGGNMGIVYLARDAKGRTVAIKTLSRLDSTRLAYLRREFKALVGVRHENLVRIFEEMSDGTNWFCVMEYIEGKHFLDYLRAGWDTSAGDTTADCLPNGGVANRPRLRDAFRQLAQGIHALHSANKLHRDIKSSNVMVTAEGRVKLLDFGLIAEMGRTQAYEQSAVVGTVGYMSPEQCGRGHLTPASDWYSFGVLLYEALTGEPPFTGTIAEIFTRKQTATPRPPSEFVSGVPRELESLCLEMLRIDPTTRPDGSEVLRRLGAAGGAPARPKDERPAFLGRERHIQELGDAIASVKRTRAPVLVEIHGPSGAGKSALVERFLHDLQAHGEVVILTGRCYEQSSVPYKAFDGLIDSLCRHLRAKSREQVEAVLPNYLAELAQLFPILGRLEAVAETQSVNVDDPHEIRRRAFHALRELLGRLGRRVPLVLFADDLQWGDRESAVLLTDLVRLPDAPPLLFLASYRRWEAADSPFVPTMKQLGVERRELPVDPLSAIEARQLASLLIGPSPGPEEHLAELVARESGGNPFIVHELVEFFRSRESAEPPTLDSVVRSRVGRLDADSRRLLEVVAVSVGPLDVECAFRAADIPPERQAAALDVLLTGKFVLTVGSGGTRKVETAHDRVQKAVVADLVADALAHHHRRLAVVLKAADGSEPEVLAYHFTQSGDLAQASHYHALAGELSAKALAFDRAAEHYRLALGGSPAIDPRRKDWLLAYAAALANAGLGREAAVAFADAAQLCPASEALFCQQRAAEQLIRSGQIDEGMAVLRIVMLGAGIALPATERAINRSLFWMRFRLGLRGFRFREGPVESIPARVLLQIEICRWASSVMRLSDVLLGSWFHSLGLLLSLQAGDSRGIAQGLARESLVPRLFTLPTAARIEHLYKLGMEVAARIPNSDDRANAVAVLHLYRMIGYHGLGHARRALSEIPATIDAFQSCTGPSVASQRSTLRMFEGVSLLCLGEVRRFRETFEKNYRGQVEAGNLHGAVTVPLISRAHQLHLIDDSPDGARKLVREAIGLWTQSGVYQQHFWARVGELEILLYEGRGREAWELCRGKWDLVALERNLLLNMTRVYAYWTRARCAVAAAAQFGPHESAERIQLLREARRYARILERLRSPTVAQPLGWSIRAAIRHIEGDNRAAVDYLVRAEEQFSREGWMLHVAALLYRRGQLVGGDVGRELIEKAEVELRQREVRSPVRFIGIYAPGFRC